MKDLEGNLILIGFMGVGKTMVSAVFGRLYSMEVIEMDERIAKEEGMSIPDIFRLRGEAYFRDAETGLLKRLSSRSGQVISCGGGAPLRQENVAEMKKNGKVVLLTAKPETIYERVKEDQGRPLLEGRKNSAFIQELLEERLPKYRAAADFIVETDGKTPQEICREIAEKIGLSEES